MRRYRTILTLIVMACSLATSKLLNGEQLSVPGTWYDQDKSHIGVDGNSTNWAINYCEDNLTPNGAHDPGENWTDDWNIIGPDWITLNDHSCWMASAANLVSYVGGENPYEKWAYTQGISSLLGTKTFDDGGEAGEALASEGFNVGAISKGGYDLLWLTDPVQWVQSRLAQNLPVAIGTGIIGSLFGQPRHALTVYGIDTLNRTVTVADSDQDETTYTTYNYTQDSSNWILEDYPDGQRYVAYAGTFLPYEWQGSGTGGDDSDSGVTTEWENAANWSTLAVPGGMDMAEMFFENYGKVKIAGAASCYRLDINGVSSASVDIESNGSLNVTADAYVGNSGHGSFSQSGGQHSIGGNLYVANASASISNYTLFAGDLAANNEYIGVGGTGRIYQSGGTNTVADNLVLGHESGSSGEYELTVGGELSAGSEYVGNGGTGTFTQTGGTNTVTGNVHVGSKSGSQGVYELSQGTLEIGQDLLVGKVGDGTFTQSGGATSVNGDLHVGRSGGTGNCLLSEGTLVVNGRMQIGYSAPSGDSNGGDGSFTQTGGTVTVQNWIQVAEGPGTTGQYTMEGGLLEAKTELAVGSGWSAPGTFNHNGGTVIIGEQGDEGNLYIGTGGHGTYNLSAGAVLTVHGDEALGTLPNRSGTLTQTGGIHTVTEALRIGAGSNGSGTYTMSGGHLSAKSLHVGGDGTG